MTNLKSLNSIRFTHHKQQINLFDGGKFALKSFLLRNNLSFSDKSTLTFGGQIYYLRLSREQRELSISVLNVHRLSA
jgi:hypothetical protein